MGFFDMKIDVIEHLDQTGQVMVARYPEHGSGEIKMGAQLTVQESQKAVFVRDGKALDTFGPGRHTLTTANVPILSKILNLPFDGKSPFRANVYFVNLKSFNDLKWGTPDAILFRDKEFQMVRLRARGMFSIRITDPEVFLNSVVGTSGKQTTSQIEGYLRNIIVSQFSDVLGTNIQSVLDLPSMYEEIGLAVGAKVQEAFNRSGIQLVELTVSAITLPEAVQKVIDEKTGMNALGDMNQFMQYKTANAIGDMANNPGGGGGMAQQAMGMGMGMMMPGMMQQAMQRPQPQQQQPMQQQPQQPMGSPCGNCGVVMQQGAKFCMSCGTPAPQAATCPKCNQGVQPGAKFCMNCGNSMQQLAPSNCSKCSKPVEPGSKFCMNCGNPMG